MSIWSMLFSHCGKPSGMNLRKTNIYPETKEYCPKCHNEMLLIDVTSLHDRHSKKYEYSGTCFNCPVEKITLDSIKKLTAENSLEETIDRKERQEYNERINSILNESILDIDKCIYRAAKSGCDGITRTAIGWVMIDMIIDHYAKLGFKCTKTDLSTLDISWSEEK